MKHEDVVRLQNGLERARLQHENLQLRVALAEVIGFLMERYPALPRKVEEYEALAQLDGPVR